eukprot:TRINITY_DN681_c0_g1_i1.p1 TRINITY_DN681_c0_g1~~TRINITY_DN681_c0_g1_i1.p1  ORF type:complete len:327 (-),score=82.82 TRINITY_DN681_c0_g1_i1:21-1001(-)
MKIAIFLVVWIFPCALAKIVPAFDESIQYRGRVHLEGNSSLFDWSGVQIGMTFSGSKASVLLKDPGNHWNVFEEMESGMKLLSVFQANESTSEYLLADGLQDDSNIVKRKPSSTGRRMEFLGASMTCGFGNEGTPPCDPIKFENSWLAWGPDIARHFGADYHIEAWSGKGVVRNYGDHHPISVDPLPSYFPLTVATEKFEWKFSDFIPQAVVINLGTNDFSDPKSSQPTRQQFQNGYRNFIRAIQHAYPNVTVFAQCGPMLIDPVCGYIEEVAMELKSQKEQVDYIPLPEEILKKTGYGCDGHPTVNGHHMIADISIPIISRWLGW